MSWEKELLGLYVSDHPIREHENYLKNNSIATNKITAKMAGSAVRVGGVITKIQKVITKASGKPMLFVTLEDSSGKIEILVFPKQLEKNPVIWKEDKIVLISGKVTNRNDELKIICDSVEEIK